MDRVDLSKKHYGYGREERGQEIASKAMEISNSSIEQTTPLEYENDQLVSKIYGITPTQIRGIQKSLT